MKLSRTRFLTAALVAATLGLAGSPPAQATTSITNGTNLIFNSFLELELGGLTPGGQHDQILASGFVLVGGTLDIVLINSWQPSLDDVYTLILAEQIVSQNAQGQPVPPQFGQVNLPDLAPGLRFLLDFNLDPAGQDSMALRVAAVPLPAAAWLFGGALVTLIGRRRKTHG